MSTVLADPADQPRFARQQSFERLRDSWLVGLLWVYALVVAIWCIRAWGGTSTLQVLVTWQPLPSQLVTLLLLWPLLREMEPGPRRSGWLLIGMAVASDALATLWWAVGIETRLFTRVNWSLLPYLAYYPLSAAAFVMFFRALGGTFRSAHARIDLATLACGVGATIWLFQVRQLVAAASWSDTNVVLTTIFCVGDGLTLVLVAMMVMRIVEWRPELPLLLVVVATFISFTTDLLWNDRDQQLYQYDAWSNAGGFGLYYALLGTALMLERHHRVPATVRIIEGNRYAMLPMLSVLIAVGMLCGPDTDVRNVRGMLLLLFAVMASLLVVVRQLGVRREIDALQASLTRRAAQTQLTELMCQSADLVAVVTADLHLGFVSPSSERLLGIAAAQLARREATQLLGDEHEPRMREFLGQLMLRADARAELELTVSAEGGCKIVQVFGSNQLHSALIAGIVLTVRDVTERRRLEHELTEIAVLERARLAQEVRVSLGSELEHIRRRLAALRQHEQRGRLVTRNDIAAVISQVNLGIDTARRLSRRLSPLNVARGALDVALRTLCAEIGHRFDLTIDIDLDLDGCTIAGEQADHVFRIVEKIIGTAARNGVRRMHVRILASHDRLDLMVRGEGVAPGESPQVAALRLAAYRAHVLGGTLRRESAGGQWRVDASIPLPV